MSESNSVPKKLSIREQLKVNPEYSTKLYIATGTTVLSSLLIILSQLYAFPGPKSSLLSFTFPHATYKIYPFKYCVFGGKDDEYGANGNGCHLSSNPLSYILSTNKLPTPPADIHLFHTLTSLSSLIYYLALHLNLLLLYHFWRRILQPPLLLLWTACLSQTFILLLPSTLLSFTAQKISLNPAYKSTPQLGTTYLFLLHTIWLLQFIASATLLALQYIRERRRRIISETDDLNMEIPIFGSGSHGGPSGVECGLGNAREALPFPPPPPPPAAAASSGYYGPAAKRNDEDKRRG